MSGQATSEPLTNWRYIAERTNGQIVKGQLSASDENSALRKIRAMGVSPVELAPAGQEDSMFSGGRARLNHKEALEFVRSMADLVGAGIPVRDALASLVEREKKPVLKRFLERIDAQVRGGEALSVALQSDPARLPRAIIALTKAGEDSGLLGRNYSDLSAQMEEEEALRQELVGQMAYPMALVVLISLTLVFLSYFVLPQFETIFSDAGATPPAETRFVLAAGAFLRAYAVWIPVGGLLIFMGVRTLAHRYQSSLDAFVAKIPVMGRVLSKMDSARYCRTLGLLLSTGAPLAQAESVARSSVSSQRLRNRHGQAAEAVRSGEKLSLALSKAGALPDDALRFIELGEKTGQLDVMLTRSAQLYEREIRNTLKNTVELIGPLMIAILGICVGGVIAAVMSGVLSLNDVVF